MCQSNKNKTGTWISQDILLEFFLLLSYIHKCVNPHKNKTETSISQDILLGFVLLLPYIHKCVNPHKKKHEPGYHRIYYWNSFTFVIPS